MSAMDEVGAKVVALTGASSGIGEATARLLGQCGAKLVLGGRRVTQLGEVAAQIQAAGGDAVAVATDVRRREDLLNLVNTATARYGRLDVLINNAGIMPISPLDDGRVEDWEAMIDVNIKGVLYGIAAALPVFRKQGSGHFVNVSSTAAALVLPNMSVYGGTKAAVEAISEGLQRESQGCFRVTVVVPGMTRTDFSSTITNAKVRAEAEARRDTIALQPDAIARAVKYAVEQAADVDVSKVVVRPMSAR
jgi:NADP-dependent 3-hydroxy acid dehydrogenase YdfG